MIDNLSDVLETIVASLPEVDRARLDRKQLASFIRSTAAAGTGDQTMLIVKGMRYAHSSLSTE